VGLGWASVAVASCCTIIFCFYFLKMCSDARHFCLCDLAAIVMGCDCLIGDERRWNIVNVDDVHL
jgi:hypothetical protein